MKEFFKSLLFLITMFILTILFDYIFSLFIKNEFLCLTFAYLIICFILIIIFRKELKWQKINKKIFKYLGLYFLCYFATALSNSLIYYFLDLENSTQAVNESFIFEYKYLAFLIMVVMGPFFEEIVFRLNFKKAIKNKTLFIIITGLLFGIAHIIGTSNLIEYVYIIPYSIMGFYLSYIYKDSDNIYISFFFHGLNNLIILVLLLVVGR